jgi:TolB-like protein
MIGIVAAGIWLARDRSAELVAGMPRSIAILPFRNLSGGSSNSELCDALVESLTEELSRVEGLRVAGRTSTLRLSDRNTDLNALARQLNVGAVLEGSVQSAGQQIRVRARLSDVSSGFQLWSGTFDRSSAEAFTVQDEIARAIATTLRLQLGRRREDPAVLSSPARRLAHDLYTKGRQLHRRGDAALLPDAREFHLRSVQADPSYPLAHSGLAHIDITIMSEGLRPMSELRPEAVQAMERALALDSGLSDAYSARIRLARDIDADWRIVESTCRDVTRLFPNAASIRGNCGAAYSILGRFPEAEAELRASVRLDPLWFGGLDGLARMLYLSGRTEEALRQAEETMRVIPDFRGVRRSYAWFLAGSGRLAQARDYLKKELDAAPESPELWALLGYVRGKLNDKPGARECLARLGARPLEVDQSLIWLGLGDIDRAVAHLEQGLERRENAAMEMLVDPGLHLGHHQRRLRAKVGL